MRYLLNEEYALRSFIGVPHCCYKRGTVKAQKLTREEFDFLLRCDGLHELSCAEIPTERVRNMIHPAAPNETLLPRQQYRVCDNRYFPEINWMLTGRCNYNCLHCFNASDLSPSASEWSWEDAEILMDEAAMCGVNAFTLTGGEPMLHPRFLDIVRGIYARGMFVHELNTNGAFLTSEILGEFQKLGARPLIKISFDGLGWHDWLRNRPGAEERTLAAIRLCTEAGFPVKVQYNVHRKNVCTATETALFLERMGVTETRIIRTSESPRWAELGKGQTLSFPEYYEHMLSFSEEWLQTPHTMAITIWHMEKLPRIPEPGEPREAARAEADWVSLSRYHPESYVCPDCRFLAAFTAEGDLVPCLQMSGRFSKDGTHLGNVKGGGLQKLLREGSYLDTVCLTLRDLINANESCANCPHFLDCQGGCRAIAIICTGDYLGPDSARCIYYREGYAARMHTLFRRAVSGNLQAFSH